METVQTPYNVLKHSISWEHPNQSSWITLGEDNRKVLPCPSSVVSTKLCDVDREVQLALFWATTNDGTANGHECNGLSLSLVPGTVESGGKSEMCLYIICLIRGKELRKRSTLPWSHHSSSIEAMAWSFRHAGYYSTFYLRPLSAKQALKADGG